MRRRQPIPDRARRTLAAELAAARTAADPWPHLERATAGTQCGAMRLTETAPVPADLEQILEA